MKNIGGQAVIEGVMMRASKAWTVAVRGPQGNIFVKREGLIELPKPLKSPVLRGVVALVQAITLGIKALSFSAEKSMGEEEKKPSSFSIGLIVLVSFALALILFFLLPLYLTKLLGIVYPVIRESSMAFNFIDGILRITLFLIYVVSITALKDIRRVFQYHGAEHRVINAYESGVELTPEGVKNYSIIHPRCGTSFLLIVMVLSIFLFSFIPKEWPFLEKFLSRVVLIPLIAGLSYEFIRFSSKKIDNPLIMAMAKPGLWLQRLTTRQPSTDQVEVAIQAMKEVLKMEEVNK
ncbi:MAG: DUF1385 domain-containing protein [Nitrospirae bacterium]|nr:DUF1385 domain-containing protein [Nitrospirota bacterium]